MNIVSLPEQPQLSPFHFQDLRYICNKHGLSAVYVYILLGEMNEKDLDTPGHSNRHAVVGPQSRESLWVLYPASLGLLRRLRVSRFSSTHPRETGLGLGVRRHRRCIQSHHQGPSHSGDLVHYQSSHHRDRRGVNLRPQGTTERKRQQAAQYHR